MESKKLKRIENVLWERPVKYTPGMLAVPIPPEPDAPKPVYWVDNRGEELFFVNSSDETLNLVSAEMGGFETCDDEVVSVSNADGYIYQEIKPNEAVKIEAFDSLLDSDYVFQMYIQVNSTVRGKMRFCLPMEKGGVSNRVLLWDNGDAEKQVSIECVKSGA